MGSRRAAAFSNVGEPLPSVPSTSAPDVLALACRTRAVDNTASMTALTATIRHRVSSARGAITARKPHRCVRFAVVSTLGLTWLAGAGSAAAQPPQSTHLTIPYLSNTASADIEFAAAECEIAKTGTEMTCHFRQVFITRASFDQSACVITSNGYDQAFRRESPARWIGSTTPEGVCGASDTALLEDGGGTRWTMTLTTKATRGLDREECRRVAANPPVVYGWREVKRPLSCATIQPGSIER